MIFKKLLKECIISTLTVLIVLLLLPTLPLILLPIYIIRQVVKLLAKNLNPELGEMVYGYTSMMAAQGIHEPIKPQNKNCTGVINFLMPDTEINLEKVYEVAEAMLAKERFIKAKMIVVKWMGFYFWKHIPNTFDLKSHFILHKQPITQKEFYHQVENTLLNEPFAKDKPLWEIHLFSKYIPEDSGDESNKYANCSAFVLKMHHSLSDWFSTMGLVQEINRYLIERDSINANDTFKLCSSEKNNSPKSKVKGSSIQNWEIIIFGLRLLLLGPFQLVRELIVSIITTIQNSTPIKPLKSHQSFGVHVPLKYLKLIAEKNGVSTPALTFAGYAGALRQLLIDLEVDPLPESISISGPVTLPWARPKDLNNYFSTIPLHVPVREADPFKRLAWAHKKFEGLKKSTQPLIFHAFFSILGELFHWMLETIVHTPFGSASFTLAPGPKDLGQLLGINVDKFNIAGGMPFGGVVMMGFYSFSVSGQVTIRITGDTALFKHPSSSKRFIDLILKEFEFFEKVK